MFATRQFSAWSTSVALALVLAAAPGFAADLARASFDRMLSHQSAPAARPAIVREPADPLIAALVVPLRDGTWPERTSDAVAESFARMLNHEPSRIASPLPAQAGTDPLIAAVVWPLLRTSQITVAGHAMRPAL